MDPCLETLSFSNLLLVCWLERICWECWIYRWKGWSLFRREDYYTGNFRLFWNGYAMRQILETPIEVLLSLSSFTMALVWQRPVCFSNFALGVTNAIVPSGKVLCCKKEAKISDVFVFTVMDLLEWKNKFFFEVRELVSPSLWIRSVNWRVIFGSFEIRVFGWMEISLCSKKGQPSIVWFIFFQNQKVYAKVFKKFDNNILLSTAEKGQDGNWKNSSWSTRFSNKCKEKLPFCETVTIQSATFKYVLF